MRNICEEHEFVIANYYKHDKKTKKLSGEGQAFHIELDDDQNLNSFHKVSAGREITKGEGIIGRVWES